MPRCKSCTVSNYHAAKIMPLQLNSGVRDLFKTKKILQGCFLKKIKLQGRKSKRIQITGMNCIFKPILRLKLVFNNRLV